MDTDILIISNNPQITQLMQMELSIEGYSVLAEENSMVGFITARKVQPRLLIIDAKVPGLSVVEICNRLKSSHKTLKILLLTDINEAELTEFCVNDYLFNPLSLAELLIRVKLNLRQEFSKKGKAFHFQDVLINFESREVFRGDRPVQLTFKEFEVLAYLLRHPYQVVERDRLLEEIWDDTFIGSHNLLQVCVYGLRHKLEAAGEARVIQTVRGVGYVLRESISQVATPALMCS